MENNLKYEKLKLHIKYISGISLGIIALTLVASSYSNKDFVGQASFAATISSIILSVIAILMTIIGETKSDNTKDKLINISEELEDITKNLNGATSKLEDTITSNQELCNGINNMQDRLESINQVINCKEIQTDTTVATTIEEDAEIGDVAETEYSYYTKVYQDSVDLLNEDVFRDLSLNLMYVATKRKCGFQQITYQQFVDDMKNLQIQFSNQVTSWDMCLLFQYASWGDDNFNSKVYKTIRHKYYNDVNKILSLINVNK